MPELITYLQMAMAVMLFYSLLPLAIAIIRRDHARIDRLADSYTKIFEASAEAVIAALKFLRRKDPSLPDDTPSAPSNDNPLIKDESLLPPLDKRDRKKA